LGPDISETAQLKIQTSNFARGLQVRDQILNKNAKLVKRGRGLDYVQHLSPVTSHVAQSCYSVIGDNPFLWSKPKFDPP